MISFEFRVKKLKFSRHKTGTFKFLAICKFSSISPIFAILFAGLTSTKSALPARRSNSFIALLKNPRSLPFSKAFLAFSSP